MVIQGISHIGITVKNLEKSMEFYRDIFGLKLWSYSPEVCDDIEDAIGVGVPDATTKVCTFEVGKNQLLELIEYVTPESPSETPLPVYALGNHHLSLLVDNLQQWYEYLTERGVECIYRPVLIKEGVFTGVWWVYLKDPDGIVLELMEYTDVVKVPGC